MSGVLAAVLSTALGGTAIVATRFLAGAADPITIALLRFAGGAVPLLPLALSITPLITMLIAALLRIEPLTFRKSIGLVMAMGGVVIALAASLSVSPPGAWRGDALMLAGAACMAFYTIWSRPLIRRSGPISFAVTGMVIGAACLGAIAWGAGGIEAVATFGQPQWSAALYLATVCGAGIYYLWGFALGTVSPTIVALTVTVNPITAAISGALVLGEPIRLSLAIGLLGVATGIWIAAGLRLPVLKSRQP